MGGSGGYARGAVRDARGRPVDVHDVHGRRRRLRAREHHARGHLRRPVPPPDDRRRPHVQPVLASRGCTASARSSTATGSGGCRRPPSRPTGTSRAPQPAQLALAAPPRRRRLQRLVHVPDPDRGAARDRAQPAAVHQVGRLRVRRPRQAGRLPDGHPARRRGLARAVDRQERRARLAVLLPPAQPLRSPRCCTRPTSTAAGWSGRASTTRSSTCSRCSTPPPSCATSRSRTCSPGPSSCTATCPRSCPSSRRVRKQFTDAQLQPDPDAFPPVRREKPPQARARTRRMPRARLRQLARRGHSAGAPGAARCARSPSEYPEAQLAAMDAKWCD